MEIPKFHETFNPILEILSNEETLHTRELQRLVISRYFSDLTFKFFIVFSVLVNRITSIS
ncbi:hypothetical protein J2X31_002061 [Flavobacterium arsenatis]|uniref:Uncharacterized protein n=1 Tax=Flavobacterium arsenatis TaxID=1484332 RepID=A0ABU1TQ25_9FLAO|nr:hypothetical protein [Flavobacterium arsenatis]